MNFVTIRPPRSNRSHHLENRAALRDIPRWVGTLSWNLCLPGYASVGFFTHIVGSFRGHPPDRRDPLHSPAPSIGPSGRFKSSRLQQQDRHGGREAHLRVKSLGAQSPSGQRPRPCYWLKYGPCVRTSGGRSSARAYHDGSSLQWSGAAERRA